MTKFKIESFFTALLLSLCFGMTAGHAQTQGRLQFAVAKLEGAEILMRGFQERDKGPQYWEGSRWLRDELAFYSKVDRARSLILESEESPEKEAVIVRFNKLVLNAAFVARWRQMDPAKPYKEGSPLLSVAEAKDRLILPAGEKEKYLTTLVPALDAVWDFWRPGSLPFLNYLSGLEHYVWGSRDSSEDVYLQSYGKARSAVNSLWQTPLYQRVLGHYLSFRMGEIDVMKIDKTLNVSPHAYH